MTARRRPVLVDRPGSAMPSLASNAVVQALAAMVRADIEKERQRRANLRLVKGGEKP